MPRAVAPDGTRLAFEVHGHGAPLLLVSGQGYDRHMWDRVLADFTSRFTVITFDHRGTGESDTPETPPYSTRGFARDVVAVLDAAGVNRAHVYGHSMGGRVAQWLGIDHPERVGGLVLGATTPGKAHGAPRDPEAELILRTADMKRLEPLMASPEYLALQPNAFHRRPLLPHAQRLHFRASDEHDAWDHLPTIVAPTLVIHGTEDRLNPTANAALLASRIPHATVALVAGGRHFFFEEQRLDASRLVCEFLEQHPLR